MLAGKNVIVIGQKDGVQGPAIAKCLESAGATPVLVITQSFVCAAAGAMQLEDQEAIKRLIDEKKTDELIVVLGSPDPESAEICAETVTNGDPAYTGPLAGVSLGLPVYHIFEDEIKNEVDPRIYETEVGIMETTLERDSIVQAVSSVRVKASSSKCV